MIAAYIAFQKYLVQTLWHIAVRGSLVINHAYRYTIGLKDSMGVSIKVKLISADKPNPDLAFYL